MLSPFGHVLVELVSVPVALCVLFLLVHESVQRLPERRPRRPLLLAAYIGLLLAALMLGAEIAPGVRIDARNGVIAVATLSMGVRGGLLVTAVGVAVRLAQGGAGALPGLLSMLGTWAMLAAALLVVQRLAPAARERAQVWLLPYGALVAAVAAIGSLGWIGLRSGDLQPLVLTLSSASQFLTALLLGGLLRLSDSRSRALHDIRAHAERMHEALRQTIGALSAAILHSDPAGAAQQRRVAELAVQLGRRLGLDARRIEGLEMAALVHDIGHIEVPGEILARPGPLTPAEYALLRLHPEIGHDILKDVDFPWPLAEIVLQHHENLDGSGYPQGLRGAQILFEARILRVCDIVEAMSSHRVYRAALGRERALQEIVRLSGRSLDPQVVEACLAHFREQGFAVPELPALASGRVPDVPLEPSAP